jgi:outer membrane protein assembly factor BamB
MGPSLGQVLGCRVRGRGRPILAAALTVVAAATLSGCMWPSFGHDLANTRHQNLEHRISRKTVDEYPANPTDPRHRSVTYALDAATGRIRWQREIPAATFGALTLANGVLFQPTVPGTLYALDARRGDVLWSVEPGGDLGGGVSVANGHVLTGHGFWFLTQPPDPQGGVVAYELP